MEDIRVYSFEKKDGEPFRFEFIHIEHNIVSSNWTLYYNNIGVWEGHFSINSGIMSAVAGKKYVVIEQGGKQAIVTGKQANREFVLYGRTVNWLLTRRTVPKFSTYHLDIGKDAESVARYLLESTFPEIELAPPTGLTNTREFWRNTTHPVSEVIIDCLDNDGAGHELSFDPVAHKWVFRVLKGAFLDLIISEANENAYNTSYTESIQDFYTGGYYETEPTGDEEPVWLYLTKDEAAAGIYKWDCVLGGNIESEAVSSLSKKKWQRDLTTKTKGISFGTDYKLGDIVKVQKQAGAWETAFEKRVKGVNLWYEHNNEGEQPIFEEG